MRHYLRENEHQPYNWGKDLGRIQKEEYAPQVPIASLTRWYCQDGECRLNCSPLLKN